MSYVCDEGPLGNSVCEFEEKLVGSPNMFLNVFTNALLPAAVLSHRDVDVRERFVIVAVPDEYCQLDPKDAAAAVNPLV